MSDEILATPTSAPALATEAVLELADGRRLEVRVVKLSPMGAMIESCRLPETGTRLVAVIDARRRPASVTWAGLRRAGIEFELPQ